MTIKSEMIQRREDKKSTVNPELEREVRKVKKLAFQLQESNWAKLYWKLKVWKSGEHTNIIENPIEGKENISLSFKTASQMDPKIFRVFLQEKLQEEGITLTNMKEEEGAELIISLN